MKSGALRGMNPSIEGNDKQVPTAQLLLGLLLLAYSVKLSFSILP